MLLWLLTLVVGCIDFKGWIVKAIEEMLSIHKWNLIKSLDGATKSAYYCCLLRESVQKNLSLEDLSQILPNPDGGKKTVVPKCQICLVLTQHLDIYIDWIDE